MADIQNRVSFKHAISSQRTTKRTIYNKSQGKAFANNARMPVKFLGKFEALIETQKHTTVATIYVVKTPDSGNLISSTTLQELGLISLHINKLSNTNDKRLDKILTKTCNSFQGSGQIERCTNQIKQRPRTKP